MDTTIPTIQLKAIVRFREFPFGTVGDPSLREFTAEKPWENQEQVLAYLRSGYVFGIPMGGGARDCIDPTQRVSPEVGGRQVAGLTEMTDGEWFWYAALIHYVEKYNVRLPEEFIEHAARHGWRVNREAIPLAYFKCPYFDSE